MNNAVGRAPLGLLGPRVALGTDGIGADMFEESRVGYLRHVEERAGPGDELRHGPRGGPFATRPTRVPWMRRGRWRGLAAGARFVGAAFGEPPSGWIVAGAPADLVVLDAPLPTPVTADTLAGHWIFGLSARAVRDVIVGGRLVVRDRRLTARDQDALAADAQVAGRPPVGSTGRDRASTRSRPGR